MNHTHGRSTPDLLKTIALSLLVILSGVSLSHRVQAQQLSLAEIKIAYLVNFARYIRWPSTSFETPDSPIIVAISKNHPYAMQLDETVAGRSKSGRNIVFKTYGDLSGLSHKHLVYLEVTDQESFEFPQDKSSPTLTVTNTAEFMQGQGLIQLVVQNRRVVFYIDEEQTRELGLKIHYKVLMMARNSEKANE